MLQKMLLSTPDPGGGKTAWILPSLPYPSIYPFVLKLRGRSGHRQQELALGAEAQAVIKQSCEKPSMVLFLNVLISEVLYSENKTEELGFSS